MERGKSSGYTLKQADIPIIIGMSNRGDRNHDIASWFGVNPGRIAEAKDGKHGGADLAVASELPPKGSPGIKGRRLRTSVDLALAYLAKGNVDGATRKLITAISVYDANET